MKKDKEVKTEKVCKKCGLIFPLTKQFWPVDKSKKDGFKHKCHLCNRLHNNIYYMRVTRYKNKEQLSFNAEPPNPKRKTNK